MTIISAAQAAPELVEHMVDRTQFSSTGARGTPGSSPGGEGARAPFWKSLTSGVSRLMPQPSSQNQKAPAGGERTGVLSRVWHPRYGPIVAWTLAAFALVWGIIYFGGNVIRTAFQDRQPAPYARTVEDAPAASDRPLFGDETEVPAQTETDRQAATAPQQGSQPSAEPDVDSDWILPLTRNQISRYYPQRALERGVEGRATLRCTFGQERYPNCTVQSERPDNWRFGSAARRLSKRFRATSRAVRGESFSVTIRFRLDRS